MRHHQEDEIEFRRNCDGMDYPSLRGIVVYSYGGDLEETIKKVRRELHLGSEWKVMRSELV